MKRFTKQDEASIELNKNNDGFVDVNYVFEVNNKGSFQKNKLKSLKVAPEAWLYGRWCV